VLGLIGLLASIVPGPLAPPAKDAGRGSVAPGRPLTHSVLRRPLSDPIFHSPWLPHGSRQPAGLVADAFVFRPVAVERSPAQPRVIETLDAVEAEQPAPRVANLVPEPLHDTPLLETPEIVLPAVAPESAPAATAVWDTPVELLVRLDKLSERLEAASWAAWSRTLIERLVAAAPVDRLALLSQLRVAVGDAESLAAGASDADLAAEWRCASYALSRRLGLWEAADSREALAARAAAGVGDRQRLEVCLRRVETLVASSDYAAAWRSFLEVDALRELAARERRADEDRELAERILSDLRRDDLTARQRAFLSAGPMAELTAALEPWAASAPQADDLVALVERYETSRMPSDARQVALAQQQLAWSDRPEDRQALDHLERYYRNCNIRVAVSADLLNRLVPQRDPQRDPVRTTILNVPVRGRSTTRTLTRVRLVPDPARLRFLLETTGNVDANTSSSTGPVTLFNRSRAEFIATTPVTIHRHGLSAEPTEIGVESNSRLRGIKTDLDAVPIVGGLLQEYVRKRHAESAPEAERESEWQIQYRARDQVQTVTTEAVAKLNQQLDERVLLPLRNLDLEPSMLLGETTESRLVIRTRLASDEQLAAHTPRPMAPADSLLSAQIHESAVNNVLERLALDGRTFTLPELIGHISRTFNVQNIALPAKAPEDLSISFADRDSVTVTLRDGRLELQLAIAELAADGHAWQDFVVRVAYRAEQNGAFFDLVRDGTVQLAADNLGGGSQLALRGVFSRIFPKDGTFTPFAGLIASEPRLADVAVSQFVLRDGWLGVALSPRHDLPQATVARAK
jgi:hypothetical protein